MQRKHLIILIMLLSLVLPTMAQTVELDATHYWEDNLVSFNYPSAWEVSGNLVVRLNENPEDRTRGDDPASGFGMTMLPLDSLFGDTLAEQFANFVVIQTENEVEAEVVVLADGREIAMGSHEFEGSYHRFAIIPAPQGRFIGVLAHTPNRGDDDPLFLDILNSIVFDSETDESGEALGFETYTYSNVLTFNVPASWRVEEGVGVIELYALDETVKMEIFPARITVAELAESLEVPEDEALQAALMQSVSLDFPDAVIDDSMIQSGEIGNNTLVSTMFRVEDDTQVVVAVYAMSNGVVGLMTVKADPSIIDIPQAFFEQSFGMLESLSPLVEADENGLATYTVEGSISFQYPATWEVVTEEESVEFFTPNDEVIVEVYFPAITVAEIAEILDVSEEDALSTALELAVGDFYGEDILVNTQAFAPIEAGANQALTYTFRTNSNDEVIMGLYQLPDGMVGLVVIDAYLTVDDIPDDIQLAAIAMLGSAVVPSN